MNKKTNTNLSKQELRNIFSFNLKRILSKKGMTQVSLSKDLNVPYQKVCDWCRRKTYPSTDDLIQLTNLLNIDEDTLTKQHAGTHEDIIANESCALIDIFSTDGFFNIGKEPIPISEYNPAIYQSFFKINDDNMIPKYDFGDLVLTEEINRSNWNTLKDGDYFFTDKNGDTYFHHLYINESNIRYIIAPLNINNEGSFIPQLFDFDELDKYFFKISKATKVIKYIK